ncbi:protein phosphatase 2C domain-containing protein [Chloroflexus sp.]|uniref:protein phosphatase 2C domain-containing protein n=1 Tax=Chloroflexus sp. TaxID=1904827 RepID=UPI002ACED577|nr:protein phosphatase 2C domain-containing protein [Chloroflexus sp.]
MATQDIERCRVCGKATGKAQQVCPHCGAPLDPFPERVIVTGERQLALTADTISLHDLLAIVEAGVAFWRRRYESSTGVAREQAAYALHELSHILASLAQQIAQGRETVQITTRLPAQRQYPLACPLCGRGNRSQARFCVSCGAVLQPSRRASIPPPPLQAQIAVRSHIGQVRTVNEDTVYAGAFSRGDEPLGALLLVADGMGGAAAGEIASQIATETVKISLQQALNKALPDHDDDWLALLQAAAQAAHEQVAAVARADQQRAGMGTTLTVALAVGRRAYLAHVGDSRAYLITPGSADEPPAWQQLTTDHTIVARLVDIGQLSPAAARTHPQRHILYRSLGADQPLAADTRAQPLAPGDILLLCSDGLYNHVSDDELARLAVSQPPDRAAAALIELANQRGGHDNISVAIARFSNRSAT